ncbi:TPA: hypothetical protein DCW54_01835 [Candidatus Dependentiae bacterium]|nr:hypothetical protein [Candidatus Dependentiae bacterium]
MNMSRYRSHLVLMLLASILLPIYAPSVSPIPRRFSLQPPVPRLERVSTRHRLPKNFWALLPFVDWKEAPAELYSFCEHITSGFRGDPLPRPIPAVGLINTYDAVTEATHLATASTLVKRDASSNFAGNTITAASFVGDLTGNASSATNFSGSLAGDVTGTQSATVVSYVGGETAEDIANATDAVMNATYEATPDTLVARDSFGDSEFNQIRGGYFEFSGGGRFSAPFGGEGIFIEPDVDLEYGATLSIANPANTRKITIQAPTTMASSYTLTLPTTAGTNGYALTTDGTGILGWTNVSTLSNAILQDGNSFTANMTIGTNDAYDLNLETSGTTRMTITSAGTVSTTGTLTAGNTLTVSSGGIVATGDSTITGNLTMANQGQIRLAETSGGGSNYAALQAPATLADDYTLTLPVDAGTNGYALTTNGSGTLNWSDLSYPSGTILQDGNSFTANMTIGTNDAYDLNLETDGTTHMTITSAGAVSTTGNVTTGGTLSSTGDFAVATNKFTVAAETGNTAAGGTLSSAGSLTVLANGANITGNTSITGTFEVSSTTTIDGILYPTGGIEAEGTGGGGSGILNIGTTDETDTLNIGTGTTAQTINLGTGAGASAINIGSAGDTINIYGDTCYNHVTELQVADKLITINKGGAAASGANSGLEVEEDSSIAGYVKTSGDRASWLTKAPASAGIVTITPGASGFTLNQGVATTDTPTFTGVTISAQGDLVLQDSDNSNYIALQAPTTVTSDVTLTLPDTAGTNGYALTTNGSGVLGWTAVAHDGGNTLGAALTLGTNDAYALNLETNGTTRMTIANDGVISTTGNVSVGGTLSSTDNFAINTDKFTVAASTGNTAVAGILTLPENSRINKVSGARLLTVDTTYNNLALGHNSGTLTNTGGANVAVGDDTLGIMTFSSSDNTAIGYQAGKSFGICGQNCVIGCQAAFNATNIWNNVAIGYRALYMAGNQSDNIAIGRHAVSNMATNSIGESNIGIGTQALGGYLAGSLGNANIAIGHRAGASIRAGEGSISIGHYSHFLTYNGTNSIAIGYKAGYNANNGTINQNNIYIGANQLGADENNTIRIGTWNDAYDTLQTTACYIDTPQITINNPAGSASLNLIDGSANPTTWTLIAGSGTSTDLTIAQNSTTRITVTEAGNTSIGGTLSATGNFTVNTDKFTVTASSGNTSLAGDLTIPATTSTVGAIKAGSDLLLHTYNANSNLFVGRAAGNRSGSGTTNTGCGYAALNTFGSGGANTAVGYAALEDLSSGSFNTAVGAQTLKNLTTGQYNTAMGDQAMTGIVTGSENIALAHRSLEDITSGTRNIGIGNASLSNVTTGSYNTAIGHVSGMNLGTGGTYNIYLGYRQLGVSADTGITRIGTFTDADANATNKCFIQGIRDVTTDSTDREVVGIDASHQLGTEGAMKVASSGYLPAVPMASASTPRILYGTVLSNGNNGGGSSGWGCYQADTGTYVITFSPAFSSAPYIVGTVSDANLNANFDVFIGTVTTSQASIYVVIPGVGGYDKAFNFIAMGV